MRKHRAFAFLLVVVALSLIWSAIRPHDYPTWFFELFLGFAGIAALVALYRRFPFSALVYILAASHFAILAVGAKYTYAEMPLFNWLRDTFHLARNHYDRVGHFAQGFVPAIVAREVLLRTTDLKRGKMVGFLPICVCLALSAFYELLEWWWAVLAYKEKGGDWLGWQGDMWDAQGGY